VYNSEIKQLILAHILCVVCRLSGRRTTPYTAQPLGSAVI